MGCCATCAILFHWLQFIKLKIKINNDKGFKVSDGLKEYFKIKSFDF